MIMQGMSTLKTAIEAITTALANRNGKYKALTSLTGATYAGGTATTTIVAGGTNVNGIIVRRAGINIDSCSATTTAAITAGGNTIIRAVGIVTQNVVNHTGPLENLFIPAGQALATSITGINANYHIWYEVL